jgi:large subunit ribosomal protein L15
MSDLLSRLAPPPGARSKPRRVGRGVGSGLGKTCGRGEKGDRARGGSPRRGFEGGQMPLFRRVPKRGFNPPNPVVHNVVNLKDLVRCFEAGAVVDADALRAARLVRRRGPVKILAVGEVDRPLTVRVDAASKAAVERIRAAGGTVELARGEAEAGEAKESEA